MTWGSDILSLYDSNLTALSVVQLSTLTKHLRLIFIMDFDLTYFLFNKCIKNIKKATGKLQVFQVELQWRVSQQVKRKKIPAPYCTGGKCPPLAKFLATWNEYSNVTME